MKVRLAQPEDAPIIASIRVAAWREAYKNILPEDYLHALDPAENLDMLGRRIAERSSEFTVALSDPGGPICGFSISGTPRYATSSRVMELWALNVLPEFWGNGIGRALVSACINSATQAESTLIELWVLSENHRAIGMYERCGFMPTGRDRSTTKLTGYPLHELCYSYAIDL
jgi:ribosomal protein S18 acetylase RimI-like enzyme